MPDHSMSIHQFDRWSKHDLYQLMGLHRKASSDEINKAYRVLAFKYHPDKNLGCKDAEINFKKIQQIVQILTDPILKSRYDKILDTRRLRNGIQKIQEKREREKRKKEEEKNSIAYEEYLRFSREDRIQSDLKWRKENNEYQQKQWKKNIKKWQNEFAKWEKEQAVLSEDEEKNNRETHLEWMKSRAEHLDKSSKHKLLSFKTNLNEAGTPKFDAYYNSLIYRMEQDRKQTDERINNLLKKFTKL